MMYDRQVLHEIDGKGGYKRDYWQIYMLRRKAINQFSKKYKREGYKVSSRECLTISGVVDNGTKIAQNVSTRLSWKVGTLSVELL